MGFLDWQSDAFSLQFWGGMRPCQTLLCDLTLSYLIIDSIIDLVVHPSVLYFVHHWCSGSTVFLMRYVVLRGGPWISKSYFIAELSNWMQLPWLGSKEIGYTWLYNALSTPFTFVFVFLRGVVLPVIFVCHQPCCDVLLRLSRHFMCWRHILTPLACR